MFNFDEEINRIETNCSKYSDLKNDLNGKPVIPLWIADMDFKTSPSIINAIKKDAEFGVYGYMDRAGDYYDSFIKWQIKRNNYNPDKNLITFTPTTITALTYIINKYTDKNDYILVQSPVYHVFYRCINNLNRQACDNTLIKVNGKYEIDFDDFENKIIKNKVKLFVLCTPHNPVGRVWTKEELTKMGEICLKHGVLVISDEIHSDLILSGKHTVFASISEDFSKNCISLFSTSKTFNLAGINAAMVIFNNINGKDDFDRDLSTWSTNLSNTFSINAVQAAYEQSEDWLDELIIYLRGNANYITDYINNKIKLVNTYVPESTYLSWIDFSGLGMTDEQLSEFMISKAGIRLNNGTIFGKTGTMHMRLNFATQRKKLELAMQSLEKAINSL